MTWEELHRKYPEDRDSMPPEQERQFLEDCFACYEAEGFAKKFWSPYGGHDKMNGRPFKVTGRCREGDFDLCVLPLWKIRFEDGTTMDVYPEEIIPREMKENGCTMEDI